MKRALFLLTLGGFILGGSLSCGNTDQYLDFTLAGNSAFLIPAEARTCVSIALGSTTTSVKSKYFTVRNLEFLWAHPTNTLTIAVIKLKFKDSNFTSGTYECNISGDELSALVQYDLVNNAFWDGTIDPSGAAGSTNIQETFCDLRCGGVSVKADAPSFTAPGSIELIGYMTDPDGVEVPIRHSESFAIIHTE